MKVLCSHGTRLLDQIGVLQFCRKKFHAGVYGFHVVCFSEITKNRLPENAHGCAIIFDNATDNKKPKATSRC